MNKKIKTLVISAVMVTVLASLPVAVMAEENPGKIDTDVITVQEDTAEAIDVCLSEDGEGAEVTGVISDAAADTEDGLIPDENAGSTSGSGEEGYVLQEDASGTDIMDDLLAEDEEGEVSLQDEGRIGKFTLDITNAVMATKSVVILQATESSTNRVIDSNELLWTSSNENVAVVDGAGFVTAISYGKATITAKAPSGTKATCKITTRFYDVNGSNNKKDDDYQYYYDAVYWGADKGITKGYNGVFFGPRRSCARREMMIFLWRKAGCPVKDKKGNAYGDAQTMFNDLEDFDAETDTNKAIAWGYTEGITKGYDDGGFHPNASIARKDALILIYRVAGRPRTKVSNNSAMMITFEDVLDEEYVPASDTYRAILWAENTGITNGYDDETFRPNAKCLREHIITFLYRFSKIKVSTARLPQNTVLGQQIASYAAKWVGITPYVWAGRSLSGGTDCSGFVYLVYSHFDLYASPASDDYQYMDIQINYDELLPGDVVVYRYGGHVGIYAGNDRIIHCANQRLGTINSSLWYDDPTAFVRLAY